jgi:hypothetical protein
MFSRIMALSSSTAEWFKQKCLMLEAERTTVLQDVRNHLLNGTTIHPGRPHTSISTSAMSCCRQYCKQ